MPDHDKIVHLLADFDIADKIQSERYITRLACTYVGERPTLVEWAKGNAVYINSVRVENAYMVLDLMEEFGVKSAGLSGGHMTEADMKAMSNVKPSVIRTHLLNLTTHA